MPFRIKVSLIILALLVTLFLVAPLIVPIAPPEGVRPLAEVAGAEARYAEVLGVDLHFQELAWTPEAGEGQGELPAFLLLHGFASSLESFRYLAPHLAAYGRVVAYDRPGFGLSERPMPEEYSGQLDPYDPAAQAEFAFGLMDALGLEKAVLVGHSSGARLALEMAIDRPERVTGLVVIGAAPYVSASRSWLSRLVMNSPQLERLGPVFLRQLDGEPGMRMLRAAWADPSAIDQAAMEAYRRPLGVENWDRALWQMNRAEPPRSLAGTLGALRHPTLVVAGLADAIVPVSESERLASELPNARLELLAGCGHVPHEECPATLHALLDDWLPASR